MTNTEIAVPIRPVFDDTALAEIKSWTELSNAFDNAAVPVEDISNYGNGFKVLDNLDKLIGMQFVVIQWRIVAGDHGEFVSAYVMTERDEKFIVNNSSLKSGFAAQLMAVTASRLRRGIDPNSAQAGLLCRDGVRKSTYTYTDAMGDSHPATTYYIDM